MNFLKISIFISILILTFCSNDKPDIFAQILRNVSFNQRDDNNKISLQKYNYYGDSHDFYSESDKSYKNFSLTKIKNLINTSKDEKSEPNYYNMQIDTSFGALISKEEVNSNYFEANLEVDIKLIQRDISHLPKNIKKPPEFYDSTFIMWFVKLKDRLFQYNKGNFPLILNGKGFGIGISYKSHYKSFYLHIVKPNSLEKIGLNSLFTHNSCTIPKIHERFRIIVRYIRNHLVIDTVSYDSVSQPCISYYEIDIATPFNIGFTSFNSNSEGFNFNSLTEMKKMTFYNLDKDKRKIVLSENKYNHDQNLFEYYDFINEYIKIYKRIEYFIEESFRSFTLLSEIISNGKIFVEIDLEKIEWEKLSEREKRKKQQEIIERKKLESKKKSNKNENQKPNEETNTNNKKLEERNIKGLDNIDLNQEKIKIDELYKLRIDKLSNITIDNINSKFIKENKDIEFIEKINLIRQKIPVNIPFHNYFLNNDDKNSKSDEEIETIIKKSTFYKFVEENIDLIFVDSVKLHIETFKNIKRKASYLLENIREDL